MEIRSIDPSNDRLSGHVEFFSDIRGWGFIQPDNMKAQIFVHYSHIKMPDPNDRRTLTAGQRVEFEINKRNGRVQAENVVPLEDVNG